MSTFFVVCCGIGAGICLALVIVAAAVDSALFTVLGALGAASWLRMLLDQRMPRP